MKDMRTLEAEYYWYIANSTAESRFEDEGFRELEQAYCAVLLEERWQELVAIFGE